MRALGTIEGPVGALRKLSTIPYREGDSLWAAGCFAAPYQGLSPVRGNSPAGFLGGGVVVTPPCYPTCDTKSHAYLSGNRKIRCSATGTLPGRASGVTPGCDASGTTLPPLDRRVTEP
jgi:hypothetical protein